MIDTDPRQGVGEIDQAGCFQRESEHILPPSSCRPQHQTYGRLHDEQVYRRIGTRLRVMTKRVLVWLGCNDFFPRRIVTFLINQSGLKHV